MLRVLRVARPVAGTLAHPRARPLARGSSVLSSLQDRFQAGNEKRAAGLFKKQMEAMTSLKKWTLRQFLDQIEKTQSDAGWRMSLPGVRSSTEVESLRQRR